MKELFREREFERVKFFQDLLEAEGIATLIRNEHLMMSGLTDFPIPEFFPALCVVRDEDEPAAVSLIRARLESEKQDPGGDLTCPACGETSPGNFTECWSCGGALDAAE